MRTGEKAGRTAAKRRTEVRRLCVRTILQGDEAQRNNPVIRPSYKERTLWHAFFIPSETTVELLVTRNSLLVTRISPFAKATGDKTHPPSREARHPPPEAVGIHMTDATNCYDSFHSLAVGIGMFPSRD